MEEIYNLILGGVYQTRWDERPFRVLAFDEIEVFYDCYWLTIDRWTFGNLRSRGYYYRMTPDRFLDSAKFIREQPLTDQELKTYRPDLPFRICRNKSLVWTDKQYPKFEDYKQLVHNLKTELGGEIVLPVSEIVLHPFGPKKGAVKPVTVKAETDLGFTCIDLLWKAHNCQSIYIRELQACGVGIYRLGHERKMPAYYIGSYFDNGDSVAEDE